jgi:hypothetical protein
MNISNTPSAHNFASMDGCASSMMFYRSTNSFTTFVCPSEAQFMKGGKVHNTSTTRLSSDLNRDPCNLHTTKSFILPPLAIPLTFDTTIYRNKPQTMLTSPSFPKKRQIPISKTNQAKNWFPRKNLRSNQGPRPAGRHLSFPDHVTGNIDFCWLSITTYPLD